ncbi:VOC family protein [Flavimaricola marinus]|uniref:Glyoxalase-like domain protein n=1 Tax=Flavimaricola marinus TaxID=1819565 RepID=A0A238L9V0_9RHOB|nr:VOC family protein [Flavimaricola marinus]SMY06185.1 Glyoxalase-like domain protein [Flavimaricola marinus]
MTQQPTVVWTEIPVTDLEKSIGFYSALFGWTMQRDDTGPNPMANFSDDMQAVSGHLYPGKPASGEGPTIHLALPGSLEEGIERCAAEGGKVLSPAISIPPGRFAYALDPDGNSIGLFEPAQR